ncbi:MAG TPA: hypothetical protein VJI74_01125 [Candidatus Paceibacterota bacterium]
MTNLNKNSLAWFIVTLIVGWFMVEGGNFELFVVFISAVIVAKLIEILSR